MAYWGEAITLGPNLNAPMSAENGRRAFAAVTRAATFAAALSARERGLIEALATRYVASGEGDRTALNQAYAAAMAGVAARFPDDPDVQTLYADAVMNTMPWDYWQKDGGAKPATATVLASLEGVMKRTPDHPGAHHYFIHLVEASNDPDRAIVSADKLGSLMPAAGHMVHMPSHIYIRVGRYADAAEANVRAIAADEDYLAQCQAQGLYPVTYYPHNVHFLWAAATFEGRSAVAIDAARKLAEQVPHHHAGAVGWTADFPVTPMLAAVRFGRWQELLVTPAPPEHEPYAIGIWRYARGLAFVARNQMARAEAERAALDEVMTHDAFATKFKDLPLLTNLQIAARTLSGEIALERGQAAAAVRLLEEAVALEDAIPYNEPSVWHQPPRQVLGVMLLAAGRAKDAEAVYRQDLDRWRENGWSLFGLAQSLVAQGRADEAAAVRRRFDVAWARADIALTSSRVLRAPADGAARPASSPEAPSSPAPRTVKLRTGVTLSYVEQGSRSALPVVLLHGFTDSWTSYERVLPSLPTSLRVFALSLRGHGDSDRPATGYTPKHFADDVAAFIDAVEVRSAVIVGHSMGATAAQRFAADHPSRTRALVLVGAAPSWRGNAGFEELLRAVSSLGDSVPRTFAYEFQTSTIAQSIPATYVDTVVGESLKVPARVWKEAIAGLARADTAIDLGLIDTPTLIVWGDRDGLARRVDQQLLDLGLSRSRLVIYEGAGHALQWEEPQRFALDLVTFLEAEQLIGARELRTSR